jgi:hypothetical protein
VAKRTVKLKNSEAMAITVLDLQDILEEYECSDKVMIRIGTNLIPIENIEMEIPEPLSMFDEPERCLVLKFKEDEYDL